MSTYIDEETLQALFLQSRLVLDPEKKDVWLKELNHWVDFFKLDDEIELALDDAQLHKSSNQLRLDKVQPGLDIAAIKKMSPRFVDGFVAVPKSNQGGQS